MRKVALIKFHTKCNDYDNYEYEVQSELLEWRDVTDDEFSLLDNYKYYLRDKGYLIVEQIIKEDFNTVLADLKKIEKDQEEKDKRHEAKRLKDEQQNLKKKEEKELKKFEELKKKYEKQSQK